MRRSTLTVAFAATMILGLTACGSDSGGSGNPLIPGGGGSDETTAIGGGGGGDLGTIPNNLPGVSDECTELYNQWIKAYGSIADPSQGVDTEAMFNELAKVLPDDLKDDAKVLAEGFGAYMEILKKYDNDMTKALSDPEAQAALEKISSDDFTKASDAIGAYFDETCGTSS